MLRTEPLLLLLLLLLLGSQHRRPRGGHAPGSDDEAGGGAPPEGAPCARERPPPEPAACLRQAPTRLQVMRGAADRRDDAVPGAAHALSQGVSDLIGHRGL